MTFCRFRSLAMRLVALFVLIPGAAVAQGTPEAAEASGPIEEILVTARKRTETLQDTPVAITAISADQIADFGAQSLADLSKMTAGLLFDSEFTRGANRPVIRGQANILGASGVSYFIDGVYVSGSIDDYDLGDVERIEIVKGPQSALYGRNSYSGAINIVTRSPGEELRASVKAEAAGDEEFLVHASISGPIGENLAGGVTLRHYEMGGHVENQFDGKDIGKQESRSISGVLTFTPNERLSIRARGYYAERDDGQPGIFARRYFDNNCYPDDGALYAGAGRYFCGVVKPGDVNIDWPVQAPNARLTDDNLQLSFRADYEINDQWQLTYIAGYGERDQENVYDGDYLPTSFQVSNFTPNGFPFAGFPVPPFQYAYVGSMTDFTFASATETDDWSQEVQLSFDADRGARPHWRLLLQAGQHDSGHSRGVGRAARASPGQLVQGVPAHAGGVRSKLPLRIHGALFRLHHRGSQGRERHRDRKRRGVRHGVVRPCGRSHCDARSPLSRREHRSKRNRPGFGWDCCSTRGQLRELRRISAARDPRLAPDGQPPVLPHLRGGHQARRLQ